MIARSTATLLLLASTAHAAPLPAWVLGRWNGVGMLALGEQSEFSSDHAKGMLGEAIRLAVDIRADAITSVPASLFDLVEGDGLAASDGQGSFRALYTMDRQYQVLGQQITIEPDSVVPYTAITMQHCVLNPSAGLALTRDGHSIPPQRTNTCEPLRLYRLPEGRIAWPTNFGWLVLERSLAQPSKSSDTRTR